jgi:primase-polymerase (primpol)-like protein
MLRERPQWITWRVELRDGRPTKIPYRPNGRGRAAVDDPASWGTFDASVAAVTRGDRDGVGFVFTAEDAFTGVDLDDCAAAGQLHPAAAAIVDRLDSYAEWSPSRCGVHVIVRADLHSPRHRTSHTDWHGRIEVYDRGRFFTITGDRLNGSPSTVEARQAELDTLVAAVLAEPSAAAQPKVAPPKAALSITDAELLDRARHAKNGARFGRLYDDGNIAAYPSASEAELALCAILAFWTGGDAARIDRLVRASALFRPKWDRELAKDSGQTYGMATIELAVVNCRGFYMSRDERLSAIIGAATPAEAEAIARRGVA